MTAARWLAVAVLCWIVQGYPGRAVDGDTFDADIIMTPYPRTTLTFRERIRVLGIDTPEKKAATMADALAAQGFTQAWLYGGAVVLDIGCTGQPVYDSFGRVLAVVTRNGKNLADDLRAAGHEKKK